MPKQAWADDLEEDKAPARRRSSLTFPVLIHRSSFVVDLMRTDPSEKWGFQMRTDGSSSGVVVAVEEDSPSLNLLYPTDEILSINKRKLKGLDPHVLKKTMAQSLHLRLRVRRHSQAGTTAVPVPEKHIQHHGAPVHYTPPSVRAPSPQEVIEGA